jgi:hypothetical protein
MTLSDVPLVRCIQEEFRLKEEQPYADPPRAAGEPLYLFPHQVRILEHVFTPDKYDRLPYSTVVISAIKKSGKTELAAAIAFAFTRIYGGEVYSIANDEEAARNRMFTRIAETLETIQREDKKAFLDIVHPDHHKKLERNRRIRFNPTDQQVNIPPHLIQYIPVDYRGEAGGMPALTIWDELWAYASESGNRLWMEMQPIPTLAVSMRVVVTYAGYYGESNLLYSIYESVVNPDPQTEEPRGEVVSGLEDLPCYRKGTYFVYWDCEPRMPWHTEEFMQAALDDPTLKGREGEYRRLWQNKWSSGAEPFLDVEIIDRLMARGQEAGLERAWAQYQ